ncbi:hypothetical protein Ancab_034491 [Ancistrocladus abbreviatus]
MGAQKENQNDGVVFASNLNSSILLEFAALGDVDSFKQAVEETGGEIDQLGVWYGRRIGSKKMSYDQRTPLMIAALYGNAKVVEYIINSGKVDVNRIAGSDGVSALHCAVAGGSDSSPHIVQQLLRASADPNCIDGNGNKPSNVIPRTPNLPAKKLRLLLNGDESAAPVYAAGEGEGEGEIVSMLKKDYPVDSSLPDINNGIYSTDEFRMYSFKIMPCSRAYTHDWTECPFAHPGENARRRDPRKFQYSCVPCPEFKKGSCKSGDQCEYAHGVFESWLHPAQYRTRLCKDETGCARKVCFFAHKKEELRPVYAATGSALPSPTISGCSVGGAGGVDMGVISQLGGFSAAPMSPTLAPSSPKWQSRVSNSPPPSLQLAGSRLRSSFSARDLDLEMMEILKLESQINQQHQQQQKLHLMDEVYGRGELKPSGIDNSFGSFSSSILGSLSDSQLPQLESPSGLQLHQNLNHLRASYPLSSSARKLSPNRLDSSPPKSVAAAMLNSRAAAFVKRSQSFIDRGAAASAATLGSFNAGTANLTAASMPASLSYWGSPDGKLDWGIRGEELTKLRKSASFGFRGNNGVKTSAAAAAPFMTLASDEPDVSWVNSLVKDAPPGRGSRKQPYGSGNGVLEMCAPWMDQLYTEQEQVVA